MIRFAHPLLPSLSDFDRRLRQIWSEGRLSNRGQQLEELESRLQQHLRCENISLFCNGTVALLLGLRAMGLQGEVITTPLTFPATVHALEWAGLTPVFCDVEADSLGLDPACVERAITEKTSAILAVHVFGLPCNVTALEAIARKHSLKLIFDAAHAFGLEVDGRPVADFGDLTMFSFHATKLFHTAEGGALIYKDDDLKEKLHLLHNFGIRNEEYLPVPGINGKLNEIQAALGLCVLDILDQERTRRALVAARYARNLAQINGVTLLQPGPNVHPSYQYMAVRIGPGAPLSRDEVFERMRGSGVIARRYMSPLCSSIDFYSHLPSAALENLLEASRSEKEILCLPFHGSLTDEEIDFVCEIIRG